MHADSSTETRHQTALMQIDQEILLCWLRRRRRVSTPEVAETSVDGLLTAIRLTPDNITHRMNPTLAADTID